MDKNKNDIIGNKPVDGQMGIEDMNLPKQSLFDKESAKNNGINLDALQAYMAKKEKELKQDAKIVDSYFADIEMPEQKAEEKEENLGRSAFDAEVEVMKHEPRQEKEIVTPPAQSGGGDDGTTTFDGSGYGAAKFYTTDLSSVVNKSMLPYTEHVILDRALPRVEDGLKPVQRRILYSMIELGLEPNKPHRKSARIVGDCLGKYHPHGDSSVYEAMVRMAQPFLMRSALVDGHGNFGSIDGDSAAASRYTEARLTPIAMELLKDLDKDTVKFTLNFDDTLKEPETLPGKFPNLLVNGASGIAVGLTTSIPTHNAGEVIDGVVAYINNPQISLKEMMGIIKGPDFPTGGYCLVNEDLERAYETGKGKVVMRAKVTIEPNGEKKNIVISEIPYGVNKAKLLQDIAELRENNKQGFLGGIAEIVDESDMSGMRAVVKLKKEANAEKILAELYKKTQLQCNFNINMVAVADGKPEQLGLLRIIEYFVNYQQQIIYRRSKFDLEQAEARAHILKGLIVAIKNIDEVVKIIKKSANTTEAKRKLMERFDLSEKQAQAILDMRLAKLTSLEIEKIEKELAELERLIKELSAIIASKKKQLEVVKKEILEIRKKYADERRTEIITDLEDVQIVADNSEVISDVVVAISASGMIKKIPYKNFSLAQKDFNDKTTENEIFEFLVKTQTDKKVALFTNKGNCHRVNVKELVEAKWKEKGEFLKHKLKDFADDEHVLYVMPILEQAQKGYLIFATKEGVLKKSKISEYYVNKYCFQTCKLKAGDEIISIFEENGNDAVIMISKKGLALKCATGEVPDQGRMSGGVKGMSLADGDEIVFAGCGDGKEIVFVSNLGIGKKMSINEVDLLSRGRKGIKLLKPGAHEELVFASFIKDEDLIIYKAGTELLSKPAEKIDFERKEDKPKAIIKIKRGMAMEKAWIYKN